MNRRWRACVCAAVLAGAGFAVSVPSLRAQDADDVVLRGVDALEAHATFSTSFNFDKSMLDAASRDMPDNLRPVVARLREISVHSFRYSAPGMVRPEALDAVRDQLRGHGWNHWMARQHGDSADNGASGAPGASMDPDAGSGSPDPVRTDVWVRMKHANVDGVVLLVANERNVNLVVVDGMIDPLELMHLRGHFGIPRDAGEDWEGRE